MKISLNWIKNYVDLPNDLPLARIAYDLTMSTVEVEGIVELGKNFANMAIGVILEVNAHPNADKLRVCKTDLGSIGVHEIVCGGTNLGKGMKVAVALPGAMVRWHGEGDLVEIKKTKLRGVDSFGMICASSEIGLADLFPAKDDGIIVDLSNFNAKAGDNLAEALNLDDAILEIDNKSLTNRPDLWGHFGIARELAAIYNLPLKNFQSCKIPAVKNLNIVLENPALSPRYIGVELSGLAVKPSSYEMQTTLSKVGVRPINSIVDITNYVMLATGQPTHAFDADIIKGNITVRTARKGEKLSLLNNKQITLLADDLVIADTQGPIALAGIMGGYKDSVLPTTKSVILEIASFDKQSIRKTASRNDLRTDAAIRYEKGIDSERCEIALSLAIKLFSEIFPNLKITGFCDNYPKKPSANKIDVSLKWLENGLGKHFSNNDLSKKLNSLGFDVSFNNDTMHVVAPSWRSTGDVSIPADILEEIARIHGFENFSSMPINTNISGAITQVEVELDRKIREYLAYKCGMNEIFTYPWVQTEYIKALSLNTNDMLSLSAPPSPNEQYIRSSLLPNLCKAVAGNLRYYNEFAIFESAQIFLNKNFKAEFDTSEMLPEMQKHVAGVLVGNIENLNNLFRTVKGFVEALPRNVQIKPFGFEQTEKPEWADNVIWQNVIHEGAKIGNIALLSKKAALDFGIKNSAVMIFELNIDLLKPYASRTNTFAHLPEYPSTERDISLLFDLNVKWNNVFDAIKTTSNTGDLLQQIIYVGEYKGKQVPEGKKSVTFKLIIGSNKKTLTSDEIDNCTNSIIKRLNKMLGAELRS